MTCDRLYLEQAVAALEHQPRPMWRPDRDEQAAAIEILLASEISTDLRRALREREAELARRAI
ncbi:hypothetical protein [Mesorhizobium sp. CAU 1741]|uniref:hypothetical protein n=1 Tax=Mesorhizobium sp. CAU 1741 TaxID=3140366 RepID=UPI00325B09FF